MDEQFAFAVVVFGVLVTVFVLCTSLIARAIIARRKVAND